MNRQQLYHDWVQRHRDIEPGASFAEDVMNRIHRLDAQRRMSLWSRVVDWVGFSPWFRAAAVTTAALLGLARIALTLRLLLFA
jgi:hypothetical protein